MRKTFYILLGLALVIFLVAGCTMKTGEKQEPEEKNDAKGTEEVDETEDTEQEDEDDEEIEQEETDEDMVGQEEQDSQEIDKDGGKLGDYEVYLGGEMVETDDKIIIDGESNLLPGARVVGVVTVGDEEFVADTTELVNDDGSFHMEIDYDNLGKETNVAVMFSFDGVQDDAILRHYGDRGQNLEGTYIYKHNARGRSPKDIYKKAQVQTSFIPDEQKVIRQFSEPDWYPIPEDLGDPRVWIEVEDVKNDEEFYYIHGRTNLLEGSKITGDYGWNHGEAWIKPDGSFDMKIEYEYKEKTPLVITFKPSSFQWNIVEEVYGQKGQKLIGDLVKTNHSGTQQYIETSVEINSVEINVPDNVDVTIDGSEVMMTVPDNVLFDFDKYDLKKKSEKTLKEISEMIDELDKELEVVINGHTDDVGDKSYNIELSEKRAEEVKKFLEKHADSKQVNFTIKGYGDTKPIASNDTESGQAKNRRVEIVINLQK